MITTRRTTSDHPDFVLLVEQLNAELRSRYGEQQKFFDQFNKLDTIRHAVVAYDDETPVGTGAIREFAPDTMEIKRMFVSEGMRGRGVASIVLTELERWSREMKYKKCVLETGDRLAEAVKLYQKSGYKRIANYGQYIGVAESLCFGKDLI